MTNDDTIFEYIVTFSNGCQYAIPVNVIQTKAESEGVILDIVEDIIEWGTKNLTGEQLKQFARLVTEKEVNYEREWKACNGGLIETKTLELFKQQATVSIFSQVVKNIELLY